MSQKSTRSLNVISAFPRSNVNYSKQSQLKVFLKPRIILIWNFVKVKIKVSFFKNQMEDHYIFG